MTLRPCDLVMKGGITSGVVYPKAVCELAKTYSFRSIGGTSAGAIAAALTAAAELGRRRGRDSFAKLEQVPAWLGAQSTRGETNLASLFRPTREAEPLLRLARQILRPSTERVEQSLRPIAAAMRSFPLGLTIGAVLAALLLWAGWPAPTPASTPMPQHAISIHALRLATLLLFSAAFALVIGIAVTAFLAWRSIASTLPRNGFGLCTGMGGTERTPALTEWLSELIDDLAGQERAPLTFGDLWGGRTAAGEHSIQLQMLSTCLTHGRPYRLPLDSPIFWYDPVEFRRYFPERVLRWLEDRSTEIERDRPDMGRFGPRLRPLPIGPDLPVIVAARMSLSFPVLLSAVPLYAIDWSAKGRAPAPERVWFSDGGICSNFPVHFFDRIVPRWPTFAINLRDPHPSYPSEDVWLPTRNQGGTGEWWTRFDRGDSGEQRAGGTALLGFGGAIWNAAQNWRDNMQARMPGYRDRIAHVTVRPGEGGLNLDMDPAVVERLSARGRTAGERLAARFSASAGDVALSWTNHRWVRFRSGIALVEQLLEGLRESLTYPPTSSGSAAEPTYADLIDRDRDTPPKSYRWERDDQRLRARELTDDLIRVARRIHLSVETTTEGAPQPRPALRVVPDI